MGINQRVSLRKFVGDIRRWVDEGKSDDWIASALGTSSSSVQSFRSRNGIYRRDYGMTLRDPREFNAYEGAVETTDGSNGTASGVPGVWFDPAVQDDERWKERWDDAGKVEMRVSPSRIVLVRRGSRRRSERNGA